LPSVISSETQTGEEMI